MNSRCRAPSPQVTRHRQAEQGTHAWVCTAAVVALIVAVSALAKMLPVLTARGVHQHETQCALALLSHAARAAGRRERVEPGASSQSVAWVATAERRGRRPRDRQNEQGTHAWVCTAPVAAFIDADRERHRLNYAQTGGDPAPDGSSHAFSPLPGWSAAGVSGGKWAGSGVM